LRKSKRKTDVIREIRVKSRDLLVTIMTKDQIKALPAELPPHG
jgi:hypothetical protein